MSFFNLTFMGYDNRFKSMKHLEPTSTAHGTTEIRKVPVSGQAKSAIEKQLAREITGNLQSREWSTPAASNLNYHTLRTMHVRGDQRPNQITRRPLTAAQEVGWWTKDEPLKTREPWTQEKRHVHAQSEMTRFVDDMTLTDRYFRLF
ncbi:unnamed protein product [Adineta steineri]|uniref:Uncharacterized protein n=2 Tax=Adineta steineri TaxID=433720 RepID=A0A815JQP9_9BILA|nr:unnamed protein product [Adineta steineri]CAF1240270.1 unnamed protein product [Adineta steineri]CAF1281610.1 unnamed protein product [Adineta steineri]CAF1315369.1 unnamed protein product [Adineta steineri]CAF1385528.1 unnamed protein product [Adineta steineri]